MAREFTGDKVTMDVREVRDRYSDTIVRARYDGTYDKASLPDELVMSSYFSVRDGKIVSLAIIFTSPRPTDGAVRGQQISVRHRATSGVSRAPTR